jgi:hypothetical protein
MNRPDHHLDTAIMSNPHPQFDLAPPLELAPFEMSVNENQT